MGMEQLELFSTLPFKEITHTSSTDSQSTTARDFQSQGNKTDCRTTGASSVSPISTYLRLCVPGGLSGKTCRAYSLLMGGMISDSSSPKLMKSGILSHGEFWTLNTCEWTDSLVPFLSEDGVCSLSDILETGVIPPQYYLSRTACLGILRRAESRKGCAYRCSAGTALPTGYRQRQLG